MKSWLHGSWNIPDIRFPVSKSIVVSRIINCDLLTLKEEFVSFVYKTSILCGGPWCAPPKGCLWNIICVSQILEDKALSFPTWKQNRTYSYADVLSLPETIGMTQEGGSRPLCSLRDGGLVGRGVGRWALVGWTIGSSATLGLSLWARPGFSPVMAPRESSGFGMERRRQRQRDVVTIIQRIAQAWTVWLDEIEKLWIFL